MEYNKLLDPQHLNNNFERYYFIPWPECQYFDEEFEDPEVIPIATQDMVGSFVSAEWIAYLNENDL